MCLLFVLVFLNIGYLIRQAFRRRQRADGKVFDFEKAIQEIVEGKLFPKPLKDTN